MAFDNAWPVACEALLPTLPRDDRLRWGEVLEATCDHWQYAYERSGRQIRLSAEFYSAK